MQNLLLLLLDQRGGIAHELVFSSLFMSLKELPCEKVGREEQHLVKLVLSCGASENSRVCRGVEGGMCNCSQSESGLCVVGRPGEVVILCRRRQ